MVEGGWSDNLLHAFNKNWASTHSKIIIGTPNRDFILRTSSVGTGELLGQTVDVVEVAITLIFVLLLQLMIVKRFIIKLAASGVMRDWSHSWSIERIDEIF